MDRVWIYFCFEKRLLSTHWKACNIPVTVSLYQSVRLSFLIVTFLNCDVIIGCTKVFRTARQLIRHKHNEHNNDLTTQLTSEPSMVNYPSPAPIPTTVLKALPAYNIGYDYNFIQPASITRQRHEILMPSVSCVSHAWKKFFLMLGVHHRSFDGYPEICQHNCIVIMPPDPCRQRHLKNVYPMSCRPRTIRIRFSITDQRGIHRIYHHLPSRRIS